MHLKRTLCVDFVENCLSRFLLRESFSKLTIRVPNLEFHQFQRKKILLLPKRHLTGKFFYDVLRKIFRTVFFQERTFAS